MCTLQRLGIICLIGAATVIAGCENAIVNADAEGGMKTAAVDLSFLTPDGSAAKAGLGGMIWSDGQLFGTVGTPAHFKPGKGPFDELYNTGGNGTFKDGVAAISESKPGDQDFNGGRWHVNLLKPEVDPAKYADADSIDDLDLDDFVSTTTYFECPLLPRK